MFPYKCWPNFHNDLFRCWLVRSTNVGVLDAVTLGANLQPDSAVLSFRNQITNVEYRKRGWFSQRFILNAFIVCFNKHVQNIPTIRFIAPRPDTNMYKVEKPAQKETSILEVIKAK